MRLVAAGVSYRESPLRARERAAASTADPVTLLRYLVGHAGLSGAAVLSTCNRTEFYLTCPNAAAPEVAPRLARYLDPAGREDMSAHLVERFDADAAEHLFRVATGVESMVVGEAQVLGQLKDAHRTARDAGTLDARLDFVLRHAISVGKRARTETRIGRGAGNLSEAALDFAEEVLGDLSARSVLLIGAGTVSSLAARRLNELGCDVFVSSRSESAARMADSLGGRAVSIGELERFAVSIDVVLASTSSTDTVLDREDVARMQRLRGFRPLCIIDLAVPRDVDPAAADVRGVTLVDIDHLGDRLASSLSTRDAEVHRVEQIIAAELASTMRALDERDAVTPIIAALLQRAEDLRREEVERTLARTPALDAETRMRIDAMTRSLISKLLHAPVNHLRETKDDPAVALTLREAFDLES